MLIRHRGDVKRRRHFAERDERDRSRRWPLQDGRAAFDSAAPVSGLAGIVPELFGRLSLIIVGGLLLATVIFYTAPRPRIPSWRGGDTKRQISVVGFNDKIALGGLGDTLESREEVMRVQLLEESTREPYPLIDKEIYLRGTAVTWYSENQWRRMPPSAYRDDQPALPELDGVSVWGGGPPSSENDPALRIGAPVVQEAKVEPYLGRTDLFFIWPLIEEVDRRRIHYEANGERLFRKVGFSGEIPPGEFNYKTTTSGLADHRQAKLVPAHRQEDRAALLQMPGDGSSLPRLRALAARWRRESGLKPDQQYRIAKHFEGQLGSSAQFHYSLQGAERDPSIDAVEDFVSNNPVGHCEYFATALALMLRSQGIPSRVVLGYRCDEWDEKAQCFQVRQLHAHAWVEAFLDRGQVAQVPESLRGRKTVKWTYGGWLRLDGTPADDLGTDAANRTTWGMWQARLHAVQHYWERYIADMDNNKQQESVYEPIRRAAHEFARGLFSPAAWRELFAGLWATLAQLLQSGIMGKLAGGLLIIARRGRADPRGLAAGTVCAVALAAIRSRPLAIVERADFGRVLSSLRARRGPVRPGAPRQSDAAGVRRVGRRPFGQDQRAAGVGRAGRAGGRGVLLRAIRQASVGCRGGGSGQAGN